MRQDHGPGCEEYDSVYLESAVCETHIQSWLIQVLTFKGE